MTAAKTAIDKLKIIGELGNPETKQITKVMIEYISATEQAGKQLGFSAPGEQAEFGDEGEQ